MKIINIIFALFTFMGGYLHLKDGDYLMSMIMFICTIGLLLL